MNFSVKGHQKNSKVVSPIKPEERKSSSLIEVLELSLEELKEKTDNFGSNALIGKGLLKSVGHNFYTPFLSLFDQLVLGRFPVLCHLDILSYTYWQNLSKSMVPVATETLKQFEAVAKKLDDAEECWTQLLYTLSQSLRSAGSSENIDTVKDLIGIDLASRFDCGMFMLKYIDFYSRGLSLCFEQEHMPYFRLRTAKKILKLKAD
ncbi:hypothetical protein GOBAR_DD03449 [Gossypium barbadense]|nr:hypothetical protein GOBAR_DD03449 [Gossypium barbadense]